VGVKTLTELSHSLADRKRTLPGKKYPATLDQKKGVEMAGKTVYLVERLKSRKPKIIGQPGQRGRRGVTTTYLETLPFPKPRWHNREEQGNGRKRKEEEKMAGESTPKNQEWEKFSFDHCKSAHPSVAVSSEDEAGKKKQRVKKEKTDHEWSKIQPNRSYILLHRKSCGEKCPVQPKEGGEIRQSLKGNLVIHPIGFLLAGGAKI